jgi:hypothetical protein
MTEKLHQLLAVVGTIDPDAYSTSDEETDWIDMSDFQELLFVVMAGVIATSGTLNFKVQEAKTSTGGSAQDLSTGVLPITQLTTGDNDKQVLVDVEAENLSEGYRYVRGVMTLATAGGDVAVLALGGRARYNPASDYDLASVDEIKG